MNSKSKVPCIPIEGLISWEDWLKGRRARRESSQLDVAGLLGHLGRSLEPWKDVSGFAEEIKNWVSQFSCSSEFGSETSIQVMTFQGAKGLEADTVCVVGLEEGTLPRAGSNGEELAEQSRLFFVSMTRAKVDLHLFHARSRSGAVSFQ
jgi:DNA helicase-2/ATP-dependent DNA helicase PcrA